MLYEVITDRQPSHDDRGTAAQTNIPNMWDFQFWEEYLDVLARQRYNVLSLWNKHPFPSLIKLPDYPDVALDDVYDESGKVLTIGIDEKISLCVITSYSIHYTKLYEVVAIGYGTTTKRKAVGAITSVSAEVLEQTPYTSTSEALQGQVAGVIVHNSGGAPGDVPSISIRGGETPLFVIDGVIQDEYAFSVLNPDDIESITFLKDAASTAIYGSRAGDGIVLVKTKRGANNKLQMRYSANYQLSQPTMRNNFV